MSQEDELKAYLSDLQLNDLIKDMTGALATTQPDEPIGFLIKFLSFFNE